MSTTFTVRIPRSLAEKMKRYREVNWSEVVRKSIEEYIRRLEESKKMDTPAEALRELSELGVSEEDLEPLPPSAEEEMYERMVGEEWRRIGSTTRAQ